MRSCSLGALFGTALASLTLAFATFASPYAQAQAVRGPLRSLGAPEASGRPASIDKALLLREREAVARGGPGRDVPVIVRFEGEALASYRGTLPGLRATAAQATGLSRVDARSVDSQRYLAFLNARQDGFAAQLRSTIPTARVSHRYTMAMNGMAVIVPATRISALAALPGVVGVHEDKLLQPDSVSNPVFIGAPALWTRLGGQGSAGEGIVIGVLDSGIWPEHPSLADPDPSGKRYAAPPGPARACEFGTGARPGPAFSCNRKLIGARRFMATYDALVGLLPTETTSARDDDGHGTHTATTAGGNRNVEASIFGTPFGIVSGVAPRAHVMVYKVCGASGCYGSDSAAAVNQAILDEVDVLNFSISGGSSPYTDPVSLAFLDAYEAGIFVAASAGNSGPAADTVDHREPWVTTVAASTSSRQYQAALTLRAASGPSLVLSGASVTPALATPAAVVVPTADPLCLSAFSPGSVAGKVVVCQRGGNGRVEKSYNVQQGGAVGMILVNPTPNSVGADSHFVPTVHLQNTEAALLDAFLAAHAGVTATLTAGTVTDAVGDVMATFSSRGGPGLALGVAKPDVTAPGVAVLAGDTPSAATRTSGAPGQLFQAIQGTSMSSPHVAGAAALLKALRPAWTPGQIRSALMTTATANVRKEDGATLADPFDMGSGRIDLAMAGDPGLLFDETGANFMLQRAALWNANYPSLYVPGFPGQIQVRRTVKNTRAASRTWNLVVRAPTDLKVSVPATITVPASGSATFTISLDGSGIPVGGLRHAAIELQRAGEATLRFPVTVVRGASTLPMTKTCSPTDFALNSNTRCTISITNPTFGPAPVTLVDTMPSSLQLLAGSVVGGTQVGNSVRWNGTLAAAQPAGVAIAPGASPAGYISLSNFGGTAAVAVGDETIVNFTVPAFRYADEVYTRLGIVSNGYLVVGGGTAADISLANQSFPNVTAPNNVLAPFWTDLDPGAGGTVRVNVLSDGVSSWTVVEWEAVPEWSTGRRASFQVWIGVDGVQDISYTYDTIAGNGDGGLLTVGAENRFGNRGGNQYVNGTGTLPGAGTSLVVTSTPGSPGGSRTVSFQAKGKARGPWTNCAQLTSPVFAGTQTACASGRIN